MSDNEKISLIFDEGTFIETGALTKRMTLDVKDAADASSEGVVTGYGAVNGRLVFVYSHNNSSAVSVMSAKKIVKVMELAAKAGAPIVGIVDSCGAILEEGIDVLDSYADILSKAAEIKEIVPHLTVVDGYCAGLSAVIAQTSDIVIMTDKARMYMQAGQTLGITDDKFGNADYCLKNGTAHLSVSDLPDAVSTLKSVIDMLPDNTMSDAPEIECTDDLNRADGSLASMISSGDYLASDVIKLIADNKTIYELKSGYADEMTCALARINGRTVGFIANNPKTDNGVVTVNALCKASEFIMLCSKCNIPLVTLVNSAGYDFEYTREKELMDGIINLINIYKNTSNAKVSVVAGKAYGSILHTMCSLKTGADVAFALPSAEISLINPAGGADIFFSSELSSADDPYKARKAAEDKFKNEYANPYAAAARGMIDDVIDASALRPVIASSLDMLFNKALMN